MIGQKGKGTVAVVDLRTPEIGSIEVAQAIRAADPDCRIVLISNGATVDSAIEAGKLLDAQDATGQEDESLASMERRRIQEVLGRTGGNKVRAAKILGLSRRALYRRIARYGL